MQNVGRPRFYIDTYSYLKAIGLVQSEGTFKVGLNPTEQISKEINRAADDFDYFHYYLNSPISEDIIRNPQHNNSVIGFLGHNFASLGIQPRVKITLDDNEYDYGSSSEIVNGDGADTVPQYDGFTLYKTQYAMGTANGEFNRFIMRLGNTDQAVNGIAKLGSIFIGTYYDMPHSPDLNLKLSYEYDGVKTIQTKGGATLSNATYTKPADWGDGGGAWQLGNVANLRSGRRVWDLSFSYLSDTDLMPVVAATTNLSGTEADDFASNILDGTDFFSQVINKTMGGHLPFVFQADNSNNSPDQFAIARFDMNSFSYDQVANNVYNVKLKIREVW